MLKKICFLLTVLFLISSCTPKKIDSGETLEKGPDSAPSDWMFSQRAFPNGINKEAKEEAVRQLQSMTRSSESRFDKPWTQVGPTNVGGRITDLSLHPTNKDVMYAGSAVGGVWKSIDRGITWEVIFDVPGGLSIGNIEISQSEPNVIYLGTGEANGSANSGAFFGNGMYKSIDNGVSWQNIGLTKSEHIARILIHPASSDTAYVAVAGKLYGKNEERGLYKTIDGGVSWEKKLYINDSTAIIDVAMSPLAPNVLFAASWERTRYAEGRVYGGFSSGIHKSVDGGDTWEKLEFNGLPINLGHTGRIGLAVAPSDPNIVYAMYTSDRVTNRFLGAYKSEDQGSTWIELNGETLSNIVSSFGWYFGNVRVNPINPDEVFLMGLNTMHSTDGDVWDQWTSAIHVDQHAMEFHPLDPNFRVIGNDGGIYITEIAEGAFTHVNTIANNQFYECAIHPTLEDTYLGGTQDNGTLISQASGINGYSRIGGGDGFGVQFDKIDPEIIYITSQFGNIRRITSLNPLIDEYIKPDAELTLRNNWNTPFVSIPNQLGGILYGSERVLMSLDTGSTWVAISEDLSNGPYATSFGTISTLAISEINQDIILAGTDDGNVHITTDGGIEWTLISQSLPLLSVSSVVTDPVDEATIYVTFSGYRFSDYVSHVFKSTNYGTSWTDISSNLPEIPVNEIVIDPSLPETYYLATDLGVFVSTDSGDSWESLGDELPPVIVSDLDLDDERRLLLAGTFGRSMYTYDLPSEIVSTTQIKKQTHINIYPNPASDIIHFEIEDQNTIREISINSISGSVLKSVPKDQYTIAIDDLPKGIYILRIVTEREIISEKFVKG